LAENSEDTVKIEIEVPKDSISIKTPDNSSERAVIEGELVDPKTLTAVSEESSGGYTNPKITQTPDDLLESLTHEHPVRTTSKERLIIIDGFIIIEFGFLIMLTSFGVGIIVAIAGAVLIAAATFLKIG